MEAFLTQLSTGFTTVLSSVAEACTTIVATPFLLFTTVFLFSGGVVGIIGRLLARN